MSSSGGWVAAILVLTSAEEPSARFREMLQGSGVDYRNVSGESEKRYIVSSLGSGAALFDYDEDGDLDLYLVNGSSLEGQTTVPAGPNRLYRNRGDWKFEDATDLAGVGDRGWGLGCAVGDYDNDGWDDLYVTNLGPNVLFRNRGDGTFEDVTDRAAVGDAGFGTSALFFDADGDGDLDLYAVNYSESDVSALPLPGSRPSCLWFGVPVFCGPSGLRGVPDVYYRNEGNGSFTAATRDAGLFDATGAYGLGVATGDYDDDGDLDLYVANDSVPNFLYRNDGTGHFQEDALLSGVAYNADGLAQAGMGVDTADLDGDGRLDLHVTNFSHDTNTLYRSSGSGFFTDATSEFNLRMPTWLYLGWATRMEDFDNDGDLDLFVVNGHVYPQADETGQNTRYRQRDQLFWNEEGRLVERPLAPDDALVAESSGRGAAFGDVDNDGDVDAVVVNIDDVPRLLRNESGGKAVTLRLIGRRSNRSAVGARIIRETDTGHLVREVRPSGGYLSSHDPRVHIGLGEKDVVERLTIRWPSGLVERVDSLPAGARATILEGLGYVTQSPATAAH
ncbi:MAG TPA: CRTAC1 family protein [Vicinamibacteria bacterium]|nr:CRTAC1 family protein [Vicinamibacteria bacterium]